MKSFRALSIFLCAYVVTTVTGQPRVSYARQPAFNPTSYNRKLEIEGQYGLRLSGSPRTPRPRQPPAPGNEEPFRFDIERPRSPAESAAPNPFHRIDRYRDDEPSHNEQRFDGPQGQINPPDQRFIEAPVHLHEQPRQSRRKYEDLEPIGPGHSLSVQPSEPIHRGPPLYFRNDHQESSEDGPDEPQPYQPEESTEQPDHRSFDEPKDQPEPIGPEHRELDESGFEEEPDEPPRPNFDHFSALDPRPLPRPQSQSPSEPLPQPLPQPSPRPLPRPLTTEPSERDQEPRDKDPFFDAPRVHDPQIAQRQKDWSQYMTRILPPTPYDAHHTKNFQLLSHLPHMHIGAPIGAARAIPFEIPAPNPGPVMVKAPTSKGQFLEYQIPRHTFFHPIAPLIRPLPAFGSYGAFPMPTGYTARSFINGQPAHLPMMIPKSQPFSFIQPMYTRIMPMPAGVPQYLTRALPIMPGHQAFYIPRPAGMVTGAPPIMAHRQPAPYVTAAPPSILSQPVAPAMTAEIHNVKNEIREPVMVSSGESPNEPMKFSITPMVHPIKLNMPTSSGQVSFEPAAPAGVASGGSGQHSKMPLQTIRIEPPSLQSVELIKPMSRDGSATEMVSIPIPTLRTMHEPMYYEGAVSSFSSYQPRYNPGDSVQAVSGYNSGNQTASYKTVGKALQLPLSGKSLSAPKSYSLNTQYGGHSLSSPSSGRRVNRPRKREVKKKTRRSEKKTEEEQHQKMMEQEEKKEEMMKTEEPKQEKKNEEAEMAKTE